MFEATEICCLTVLEAKSPRSRCRQLGIFLLWLADGLLCSAPLHGLRASLIGMTRQILLLSFFSFPELGLSPDYMCFKQGLHL